MSGTAIRPGSILAPAPWKTRETFGKQTADARNAMRKSLAALRRNVDKTGAIANHLSTFAMYRMRVARSPFLPSRIDLEPNNTCNLRCPHCQVTYWTKDKANLDPDGFRAVLEQFPRLLSVKLQGMGEPFLNRHLLDMLAETERRNISAQVITNGTILTEVILKRLVAMDRAHICFSVDGASAAVHEGIRIGSCFGIILENMEKLIALRGIKPTPLVSMTTVITNRNASELPDIVRLAGRLGVDSLWFQTFLTNWGKHETQVFNEKIRIPLDSGILAEAVRDAKQAAKEYRVPLKVRVEDYYTRSRPCPWPWTRTFIAANGDVVPCCIIADSDVIRMGNIFDVDFAVIWNSAAYRDFRDRIRTHNLHDFCRNCYQE